MIATSGYLVMIRSTAAAGNSASEVRRRAVTVAVRGRRSNTPSSPTIWLRPNSTRRIRSDTTIRCHTDSTRKNEIRRIGRVALVAQHLLGFKRAPLNHRQYLAEDVFVVAAEYPSQHGCRSVSVDTIPSQFGDRFVVPGVGIEPGEKFVSGNDCDRTRADRPHGRGARPARYCREFTEELSSLEAADDRIGPVAFDAGLHGAIEHNKDV